MRVLQVHARYRTRAGEDTVVDQEATALERAGHDVGRLIVDNPAGTAATLAALGRCLDNRPAAAAVGEAVRTHRPDVVHVHNTWFALSSSAVAAAASSSAPVVMTVHNFRLACLSTDLFRDDGVCTACIGRAPWAGVRHGCYRNSRMLSAVQAVEIVSTRRRGVLDRAVSAYVAPTRFVADRLADIGVPPARIVVKPHFTTDPGPRHVPPSASDEIVSVGRLVPGKGLESLLEAWRRSTVSRRRRLVIIGDGPLADPLAAFAAEAGITDSVDFVGWQDRMAVLARLRRARALMAPIERYEPFGMVVVEAMSCGLPVVVSNVAGLPEIAGPSAASVVPPGDPAALATALDRLDECCVDTFGAAGRDRYERDFAETVGVEHLEAVYDAARRMDRP